MPRIHFAVLAHANEPCVTDLVRTLWELYPTARVSVFNGGRDPSFLAGQGVPLCPGSTPLRYGNLTAFHIGVMRWLVAEQEDFDFLVTLDHDVMPLRGGLGEHLAERLTGASYMGARFRPADSPETWQLGGSTVAQVNDTWATRWQPLFGTPIPYWAFNPGQVFTRELVERIVGFPRLEPLMALATRSRIWAMEEVVYPTLAVAVGGTALELPGEAGLVFGHHTPQGLTALVQDPDVFFAHRIGMTLTSPDRRAVHALLRGDEVQDPPPGDETAERPVSYTLVQRIRGEAINKARRRYDTWYVKNRA